MTNTQPQQRSQTIQHILVELFDIISFFIFIVGLLLSIRLFLFNPFTVVGQSMEPTIHENDFIIIDKITPQHNSIVSASSKILPQGVVQDLDTTLPGLKRGDVIVFVPPGKDLPYIKRIIGLPGEVVKVDDGLVFICDIDGINCTQLAEPYLPEGTQTIASCNKNTFEITGGYFVMGDHRGHTTDSLCCFGILCTSESNYVVPDNYIIGKALFRVFPKTTRF